MALRAVVGGVVRRGLVGVGGGRAVVAPTLLPAVTAVPQPQCQPARQYAMRQELTEHGIMWRRPQRVDSWRPAKSGDLSACVDPQDSRVKAKLQVVKEALDGVDDITRQLLTLQFGTKAEKMKVSRYDSMRDIQRHQYDTGSLEVTIAMLTVRIRKAQQELQDTKRGKRHTVRQRVALNERIARRKKLLKHLRRMDYKRFEWLIHKLDILYRPPPRYVRWVTRKISLRKLVHEHGRQVQVERLREYKEELEGQTAVFIKEKEQTLRWIANTEKELGLPVSVQLPGGVRGEGGVGVLWCSGSGVASVLLPGPAHGLQLMCCLSQNEYNIT
ncbi:28S ribosomal protein S15, mitochondrial-like [Portunus trituberculatus]|uniref:28S ribosomal protein S15, mitochondrial-like n=1 Tax=Portunus trituberculatus TaxID=210409 RepID=UPI001E1CEAF7|nr:28S ribosomal protein S15, mitochondrial-like [Portunus trituberculatus]